MARGTEPSPQKQFIFIVVFIAVVAGLIFAGSFYLPQDAAKLAYMAVWTVLIAGAFWLVERFLGTMFGKKK